MVELGLIIIRRYRSWGKVELAIGLAQLVVVATLISSWFYPCTSLVTTLFTGVIHSKKKKKKKHSEIRFAND